MKKSLRVSVTLKIVDLLVYYIYCCNYCSDVFAIYETLFHYLLIHCTELLLYQKGSIKPV